MDQGGEPAGSVIGEAIGGSVAMAALAKLEGLSHAKK
jgi:hypothetical protein